MNLNEQDVRDVKEILNFYWDDEENHFLEEDKEGRKGHIFQAFKRLNAKLNVREYDESQEVDE